MLGAPRAKPFVQNSASNGSRNGSRFDPLARVASAGCRVTVSSLRVLMSRTDDPGFTATIRMSYETASNSSHTQSDDLDVLIVGAVRRPRARHTAPSVRHAAPEPMHSARRTPSTAS